MVADKKRALAEQHGEAFAKAELGTSGANPKNAKRQYSRLVRNFKLTLNIHVSEFTVSDGPRTVKIPFLKPSDVLTTLLQKYPWLLLLGGCEIGAQSERLVLSFWDTYRKEHPTHDVFQYDRARLSRTIPLTIHGDGGRTQKKQPLEVFSFEPTLGLNCAGGGKPCSCRCEVTTTYGATADFANPLIQVVTNTTHSYRIFWSLLIHRRSTKRFPICLMDCLDMFLRILAAVCETGIVSASGERFYVACLGFKLDMEWGVKAAQLTRSYMNVGYKNEIACCAECDAGITGVPFEDCNDDAAWLRTRYNTLPMVHTSSVVVSPI